VCSQLSPFRLTKQVRAWIGFEAELMVGTRRGPLSAGPSPRSIKLSYLGITLLAAVLLTARYKLLAPDGHPYGGAGHSLGHQAYSLAFKAGQLTTANDKEQSTTTAQPGQDDEFTQDEDDWFMVSH